MVAEICAVRAFVSVGVWALSRPTLDALFLMPGLSLAAPVYLVNSSRPVR